MQNKSLNDSGIKIKFSDEKMWHKIDEEFNENGGVYILKCSTEINNFIPVIANRLVESDKNGILYIGKANSFIDRVIDLKKSISPQYTSRSHECGARYKDHKKLQSKFPFENLYIELYGDSKPLELEKIFLKEYELRFGELPPINRVS
jgi:hypothetical protein